LREREESRNIRVIGIIRVIRVIRVIPPFLATPSAPPQPRPVDPCVSIRKRIDVHIEV
jgi:hypothetical protein